MNKESEGLEGLGELLRQGPVDAAVEVEPDVHSGRLRRLDASDDLVEYLGRADPAELGRSVHLDRGEALFPARLRGIGDLVRTVAADPCIGPDLLAHSAAQHLPCRKVERSAP